MFELPKLKYDYDALEPHIDARTMELHHTKHHQGYTTKLNEAIEGTAHANASIEEILKNVSTASAKVRNNGGGYYNHKLFWDTMGPNGGGKPTGALADAIKRDFGSYEDFKTKFSDAAATQFGSGWAWLLVGSDGKLHVSSTPNQDNPLMDVADTQGTPVLGLDVWEHAYYLNYQNRRADYIDAFFKVVDWSAVGKHYEQAK